MKKSYSLFEMIFVLTIILIISSYFIYKPKDNSIDLLTNRLILHLKETRYKALLDDKFNNDEFNWYKKRWTIKFQHCVSSDGGIYYTIYSDTNKKGHPNMSESLSDPLVGKKIYSSNKCKYSDKTSKYSLLTKEFNIVSINIDCNKTSTIGQISFGSDGKVYTKLDDKSSSELKNICTIRIKNKNKEERSIKIHGKTGFVEQNSKNLKI